MAHRDDVIQKQHLSGQFYETEELEIIENNFAPGSVFFDVGANVGNHTVFCGLFLDPKKIIVAEPNPTVEAVLKANIRLNALDEICDTTQLGVGIGKVSEKGFGISWRKERWAKKNLGGATLQRAQGDIEIRNGDEFLDGERADFIKIDVEGMEILVLEGLRGTINRFRPRVFVEIDNENLNSAQAWMAKNRYEIKESFRRYSRNTNFLLVPKT